ncbi:hypothetical protein DUNSADRAFT_9109, partial [Dunaliella salina]
LNEGIIVRMLVACLSCKRSTPLVHECSENETTLVVYLWHASCARGTPLALERVLQKEGYPACMLVACLLHKRHASGARESAHEKRRLGSCACSMPLVQEARLWRSSECPRRKKTWVVCSWHASCARGTPLVLEGVPKRKEDLGRVLVACLWCKRHASGARGSKDQRKVVIVSCARGVPRVLEAYT